jgi:hypothetical protein
MVINVRFSTAASRPSGRVETELFSMLNSSNMRQFANDFGIEPAVSRLYLGAVKKVR